MFRQTLAAFALGTALVSGSAAAFAQPYGPPPGAGPGPYADTFTEPHRLRAVITNFSGGFHMMVRVRENFIPVNLHQGTIIHPTGLTLHNGMLVRVDGYYNGNGVFIAERITLVA
jgi:hypothetical protein